jgi:hypothetical protein
MGTELEDPTKPWYYAGPYVWSGVIYGHSSWPSFSTWFVPGTDPDERWPNP